MEIPIHYKNLCQNKNCVKTCAILSLAIKTKQFWSVRSSQFVASLGSITTHIHLRQHFFRNLMQLTVNSPTPTLA